MDADSKDTIRSMLFFDTMLMPKIITFIYWLLLAGVLLGGFGMMLQGEILSSVGVWVFGAAGVRLWCELLIVMFKINANIQKIADKQ